jgi:hypothetical protein
LQAQPKVAELAVGAVVAAMRAHPQLPIIQEHGCLALARIAFDEVQQPKVRHPNASEATA